METLMLKKRHTVISVSIFGRFRVEDKRKGIKKYALSYKNVLVRTGENNHKASMGENL